MEHAAGGLSGCRCHELQIILTGSCLCRRLIVSELFAGQRDFKRSDDDVDVRHSCRHCGSHLSGNIR